MPGSVTDTRYGIRNQIQGRTRPPLRGGNRKAEERASEDCGSPRRAGILPFGDGFGGPSGKRVNEGNPQGARQAGGSRDPFRRPTPIICRHPHPIIRNRYTMNDPAFPRRRPSPWYVPAWYNTVRTWRTLPPHHRCSAGSISPIIAPDDPSPSDPFICTDPSVPPSADFPQAWRESLPDGTSEWFYNYPAAMAEARYRRMRLPDKSDREVLGKMPGFA